MLKHTQSKPLLEHNLSKHYHNNFGKGLTAFFSSVPTNAEADEGMNENGPCPIKTIPRENSSTDLNSHLKYDKSVNSMLDEAAQMRKDLEAKRAAKRRERSRKYFCLFILKSILRIDDGQLLTDQNCY